MGHFKCASSPLRLMKKEQAGFPLQQEAENTMIDSGMQQLETSKKILFKSIFACSICSCILACDTWDFSDTLQLVMITLNMTLHVSPAGKEKVVSPMKAAPSLHAYYSITAWCYSIIAARSLKDYL